MTFKLVGLAGSFNRPSKTYSLVKTIVDIAVDDYDLSSTVFDLQDVGPSLGLAQW